MTDSRGKVLPQPVEPFMPHRLPMRMVDRLLRCSDERAEVEAWLDANHLLIGEDGRLEPLAALELLAQAQAAAQGYRDWLAHKPVRTGYLVGISNFELLATAGVGERLLVRVTTCAELGDFALIEGEILAEDRILARGSLKLWLKPEDGAGRND